MTYRMIQSVTPVYDLQHYYPAHSNVCRLTTLKNKQVYIQRLWGYRARQVL